MTDDLRENDDDDDALGLTDWSVPAPPAHLVDQVVARIEGTGVHPATAHETATETGRRRGRVGIALVAAGAIAAAGVGAWIGTRGADGDRRAAGGPPSPTAVAPGQLVAAADSTVSLAPGTVAKVSAGGELAWHVDADGNLRVTQRAGTVTYQHERGTRLTVDAAFARVDAERATVRVEVPMNKRVAAGVVGAAVATAVVVACYHGSASVSTPEGTVALEAGSTASARPGELPEKTRADDAVVATARTIPTGPRRLASPAARAAVLDEMAKARARREIRDRVASLNSAAGASGNPGDPVVVDMDPVEIRDAVREVVPLLAECYDMAPQALREAGGSLTAELHVAGEPEVGTVFEDASFTEGSATLLGDADFTDCVRETLLSVEMPPLEDGVQVVVRYPFVFSLGEPDEGEGGDDAETTEAPAPKREDRKDRATERTVESEPEMDPEPEATAPATAAELIDQANNAARSGQYGKALASARRALKLEPDNQQAHTVAAIAACNLKDKDAAELHIGHLVGSQRAGMIRQVCKRSGVKLAEPTTP